MSKFKQFHYHLNTEKLPKGSGDLTFVLLADLHNYVYGPGNQLLLGFLRGFGGKGFPFFMGTATMSTGCVCIRRFMGVCTRNMPGDFEAAG